MTSVKNLKSSILELLDKHKSENIVEFDLLECKEKLSDWCIVASGTSSRHMQSVADYVYRFLKDKKLKPLLEGDAKSGWIMLEAAGIEVHLFKPELRDYYDLESLMKSDKRPNYIK
jgi:ribosome-associated protein